MSTAITASSTQMGKLTPVETALFVCDVQERFRPLISGYPAVIDTSRRMVSLLYVYPKILLANPTPPLIFHLPYLMHSLLNNTIYHHI